MLAIGEELPFIHALSIQCMTKISDYSNVQAVHKIVLEHHFILALLNNSNVLCVRRKITFHSLVFVCTFLKILENYVLHIFHIYFIYTVQMVFSQVIQGQLNK